MCILTLELSDGEQYLHEYNLKKLPFTNEGQLRKHILPWIPSLQIPINNQDTKLSKVNCAIAPSGMGKTSFIARCMTEYPGLLITGSTKDDTGETTDRSVAHLHGCLESITQQGEKYAIIRQAIHVLFISHLIHIIKAIKNVEQNPLILQPFDNNLNAYIGYIQCNENTEQISKTFDEIFAWAYFKICDLRNLTKSLIRKVCKETKSEHFLFCVDEANVFDKHFGIYKSVHGDRGLLSVIYSEISILMSSIYDSNPYVIYAGTNFSIENNNYSVQSSIGKTSLFGEIQYLMNFDYFDLDGFISFLKLHITIPKQEEDDIRQHWTNRFPIRRKVAGLILEQMVNYSEDVLEQSFNKAVELLGGEIKKEIENEYSQSFRDVLFKYILHYECSNLLGHEFIVKGKKLANKVLHSGLTAPKVFKANKSNGDGEYVFEARDYLGYTVAKYILGIGSNEDNESSSNSLIEKCKLYVAEYATNCEELDTIVALSILECEGQTISDTVFSNDLTIPIEHQFKNLRIMIPSTFKQYCLDNEWINKYEYDTRDGEELYWRYLTDKSCGWSHIDGIIFKPSKCHADILLFSKSESDDEKSLFISTKCTYGKDRKRAMDEGFKSTLPTLFYLDNYQSISIRGKTVGEVHDNINKEAESLKINESAEWWEGLHNGVLKVLNESVICLQVIVNMNEMETTQFTPPPGKYFNDSIYIDRKENGQQFFGKLVNDELNDFINNTMTINEKEEVKKKKKKELNDSKPKKRKLGKRKQKKGFNVDSESTTTTTTKPSTTKSKKRKQIAKEEDFSTEDKSTTKSKKRKQEKVEKKHPPRSANRS